MEMAVEKRKIQATKLQGMDGFGCVDLLNGVEDGNGVYGNGQLYNISCRGAIVAEYSYSGM